jgi:hypothetical protein
MTCYKYYTYYTHIIHILYTYTPIIHTYTYLYSGNEGQVLLVQAECEHLYGIKRQ